MKLFVGGLPFALNDEDLRRLFEAHGEVASANIVLDRATGRSRGFGFVEMPNAEQAETAIREVNGSELEGRVIKVEQAQERPRSGGGGQGRRGGGPRQRK
ncbi:MAG: RNA-binding protein [Deltaproteobacteria bacterium]|nr:RNA-binding protein [Deltaproteobacteria bacterium]